MVFFVAGSSQLKQKGINSMKIKYLLAFWMMVMSCSGFAGFGTPESKGGSGGAAGGGVVINAESALDFYRQVVPTAHGVNRLGASISGSEEKIVQDLSNTYLMVNAQWFLARIVRAYMRDDHHHNFHGFLVWHHYLYLAFVTGTYVIGGINSNHPGQAAAFAVNAAGAYLWSRWWYGL